MKHNPLRRLWILLIVPILVSGCGLFPEEEDLPAAPIIQSYETQEYTMTTVMRGDLEVTRTVRCKYVPAKSESLSFALGGEYIENIYAAQGELVKAGDVLAELVQDDLKDKISAQEYQIRVTELKIEHLKEDWELEVSKQDGKLGEIMDELEEVRRLIVLLNQWLLQGEVGEPIQGKSWYVEEEPTDLSMEELKAMEAELVAERDARRNEVKLNEEYEQKLQDLEDSLYIQGLYLEELQQALRDRQIVAGIDGTVTYMRKIKDGQKSVEGEFFTIISDMTTTAFTVEGNEAAFFPVGTKVTIIKSSTEYTAVSVEASVLGLEEPGEGEELIAYLMLDQPDPSLESGDTGSIRIVLESSLDTLYVLKETIKTANGRQFVYVLNEDGLKVMQDVTVGITSGKYIEILSGLKEGDSVIVK